MNPLPDKLGDIAKLYAHTKYLILKAEEIDPELKSCVPIIKELRDAFDHIMRYVGDYFSESPKGSIYQEGQLEKVIGHVFRASYDAMDCLSISLKIRLNKALNGKSHEAIVTVFPAYFGTHIIKLNEIDERVAQSRQLKDVGGYSQMHLQNYLSFLTELQNICAEAEGRVAEMVRYDQRQKSKSLFKTILALVGMGVAFLVGILFERH